MAPTRSKKFSSVPGLHRQQQITEGSSEKAMSVTILPSFQVNPVQRDPPVLDKPGPMIRKLIGGDDVVNTFKSAYPDAFKSADPPPRIVDKTTPPTPSKDDESILRSLMGLD